VAFSNPESAISDPLLTGQMLGVTVASNKQVTLAKNQQQFIGVQKVLIR